MTDEQYVPLTRFQQIDVWIKELENDRARAGSGDMIFTDRDAAVADAIYHIHTTLRLMADEIKELRKVNQP